MYTANSAPWLLFYAWNDDDSPKDDLDASTTGLAADVVRPGLADVSIASFSDASGPTDWAAGKIWPMGGNLYQIGVATASISAAAGYMVGVAGSYTGGRLNPVMVEVSAYNPTTSPNSTAPATPTNVTDARDAVLAKLPAALVGGRMDASVGNMQANTLTASALAADAGAEIAALVETYIVNEGDATAVLQAIADKIASDWIAGDASPVAVASAVWQYATRTLTAVPAVTLATTQPSITWQPQTITAGDGHPNITLAGSGNADGIAWTRSGSGDPLDQDIVDQLQEGVATSANQTTMLNRLGAWTGSGVNTILGAFKALLSKTASAPSDIGGTFDPAADSTEAIRDRGDVAWLTGAGGGSGLTGPYTRTITVTDADTTDPIQGAYVRFYKTGSSETKRTNASGVVTFTTEAATWTYAVIATGYAGATADVVVSADGSTDVELDAIAITPSPASTLTGYVVTYSEAGVPEAGVVVCMRWIGAPSGTAGLSGDTTVRTTTSDGNGLVEFTGLFDGHTYEVWRGSATNAADIAAGVTVIASADDVDVTGGLPLAAFFGRP